MRIRVLLYIMVHLLRCPKTCLVFDPPGASLADARKLAFGGRMPINVVKSVTFYMLQTLDFLHVEANLVHGGMFLEPDTYGSHIQAPGRTNYWLYLHSKQT